MCSTLTKTFLRVLRLGLCGAKLKMSATSEGQYTRRGGVIHGAAPIERIVEGDFQSVHSGSHPQIAL
jgi:hypothetical protein